MVFEKAPKLPEDLAKLDIDELNKLCGDIRKRLVDVVSKNGGHLASNLGVVEMTVALYSVYNPNVDRIVWDVGHQTYVHKILTGRDEFMENLRRKGGISGFPKRSESIADAFNTGHSSTSISAALGMARGYNLAGDNRNVVAIIGDGALTGGMAFEALNDAAQSKCNIKVVLNDNGMSIDKNVGGLAKYLAKIRKRHSYMRAKKNVRNFLLHVPKIGEPCVRFLSKQKNKLKNIVVEGKFFADMGFHYLGPVNGHDIYALKMIFERAKSLDGPVLIHVQTQKGRGYEPAEKEPGYYHGVNNFNAETGTVIKSGAVSLSTVFAEKLVELAKNDEKITAITAAMSKGTGLVKFKETFPDRFFDVGIAEQHAVTMAAGLSASGMKPVVAIYSTFMQRAYDQLMHDVCIGKIPLVAVLDRAGVCGYDGETHHGIYDFAYLSTLPNTAIFAPSTKKSLQNGLKTALSVYDKKLGDTCLFAIRYPARLRVENDNFEENNAKIEFGKGRIVYQIKQNGSKKILLISIGQVLSDCLTAAENLAKKGYEVTVFDALFLRPLDKTAILSLAKNADKIITVEDAIYEDGLGMHVKELLAENNIGTDAEKFTALALPQNDLIEADTLEKQLENNGISAKGIEDAVGQIFG